MCSMCALQLDAGFHGVWVCQVQSVVAARATVASQALRTAAIPADQSSLLILVRHLLKVEYRFCT